MRVMFFCLAVFVVAISATAAFSQDKGQQPSKERLRQAPSVPKEPDGAPGGSGSGPARMGQGQPKEPRFVQQKGPLERFKDFQGEKTPATLTALLSGGGGAVFQEPPIALADGQSTVKLTVNVAASAQGGMPSFAVKGAQVLSIRAGEKGNWIIEAQPVKGAYQGALTVLTADAMIEYPLILAPPADIDLDKSGKIEETDFEIYLKSYISSAVPAEESKEGTPDAAGDAVAPGAGTPAEVKRDLNGDGREDYIDDYIFTANYLVAQRSQQAK